MTEDEAKAKWCPFVRLTQGNKQYHPVTNRFVTVAGDNSNKPTCLASACMAWRARPQWRWTDIEPPEWHDGVEPAEDMKEQRMGGYCGLAGPARWTPEIGA